MPIKLMPQYDGRKSFGGKAKIKFEGGKKVLQSYQTDVAEIVNGKPFVKGTYSPTTTRHIKEFLRQNGFYFEDTKDMMRKYGVKQAVKKKMNGGLF